MPTKHSPKFSIIFAEFIHPTKGTHNKSFFYSMINPLIQPYRSLFHFLGCFSLSVHNDNNFHNFVFCWKMISGKMSFAEDVSCRKCACSSYENQQSTTNNAMFSTQSEKYKSDMSVTRGTVSLRLSVLVQITAWMASNKVTLDFTLGNMYVSWQIN